MGTFTEETLLKFQAMCAEGMDFGEGEPYDFKQCLMSNGDIYGVEDGEACDKGKAITDAQAKKIRAGKSSKGESGVRMAKLKAAFRKKTGREMTPEEKKKAAYLLKK